MTFHDVYEILLEGLQMPITYFTNPSKRIHFIYLLSAIPLAYYIYHKTKVKYSFVKFLFQKKIWWSKSAFVDYSMLLFNSFVKIILIGPFLIYGLYLSFYTNEYLLQWLGFPSFSLSVNQTLFLYTLALTITGDFMTYVVHSLMHRIPFLWEFHKIHHSATVLNPITQYRIHPVELLINNVKNILVFGIVTGVFDYLSNHQVHKMMFLGANVFSVVFLFMGANLRHSHVKFTYFHVLEYIFISPFQHQIHHSDHPKHFNKNMGSKLAIWDWLFGTWIPSKNTGSLRFGIGKEEAVYYNSLFKNLYMPFRNIYFALRAYVLSNPIIRSFSISFLGFPLRKDEEG